MAEYRVKKVPLRDLKEDKPLKISDVITRTVKEIDEFEKKHGEDYLERIDNKEEE